MNKLLPGFLKWRYELYLAEKIDLYGSLGFYLKSKYKRAALMKHAQVVYLYANKRNVGDYISFLGIKEVIGKDGPELFCSPVWEKSLSRQLEFLKQNNPNCTLIIGGGGLLQPVFASFWELILTSGLRFAVVGVGVNLMKGRELFPSSFIGRLIEDAIFFSVRDTLTLSHIPEHLKTRVQLHLCPSVNYVNPRYGHNTRVNSNTLLHMKHPSDLRLSGINEEALSTLLREMASERGLEYEEHTNMCANHEFMLRKVSGANVVVSSRLHGCIMAYACGIPFLPIFCDEKIAAFNNTHSGVEGIMPSQVTNKSTFSELLTSTVENFTIQDEQLRMKIKENAEIGRKLQRLI